MKYSDMRGHMADRTKKGNLTKKATKALATVRIPPATPATPNTGNRADFQGNVYAMHSGGHPTQREARRANKTGRFGTKPMRSRIQRLRRKQKTGGVK